MGSLINQYIKRGKFNNALSLYQTMSKSKLHDSYINFPLDGHTYVDLIKVCIEMKDIELGHQIHINVCKLGLIQFDVFVGSTLVDMYAKCGLIFDAKQVLKKLQVRNVVTWNALIGGLVKIRYGKEALISFQDMKLNHICPDVVTFMYSLKACGICIFPEKGREIHSDVAKMGLLKGDPHIESALVNMYIDCGLLAEAYQVFVLLNVRDVVTWNTLISGYIQYEHYEKALNVYEWMDISPNAITYGCILKACGSIGAIGKGSKIHARVIEKGLLRTSSCPFLGNMLVEMYAKCGIMSKAQEVFDSLPLRNIVTWTSLMGGYAQDRNSKQVMECWKWMKMEGIPLDAIAYACLLKTCGSIKDLKKGKEIHEEIVKNAMLKNNLFLGAGVVDMYIKCGSLREAHELFDTIPVHDTVMWNALIGGYVQENQGEGALRLFEEMKIEGVLSNSITLSSCLKACGGVENTAKGRDIHAEISTKGLVETDAFLGSVLVDMYAKWGSLVEANVVFCSIPFHDVVTWNALLAGYVQQGHPEKTLNAFQVMHHEGICPDSITLTSCLKACGCVNERAKGIEMHAQIYGNGLWSMDSSIASALVIMYANFGQLANVEKVFNKHPVRDVVAWNALISAYVQHDCGEQALCFFEQMKVQGISPEPITFACYLKACASIGTIEKGIEIHSEISKEGLLAADYFLGIALIDMYAKFGMLVKAWEILDTLPVHTVVSWTAFIAGCVQHEYIKEALDCFKQMQLMGIPPDAITLACELKACNSIGAIEKGIIIHAQITAMGFLKENLYLGNMLLHMYAKQGMLTKAEEVFNALPNRDVVTWTTLIEGYVQNKCSEDALNCINKMQNEGVSPNHLTVVWSLKACGDIGDVNKGHIVHGELSRMDLLNDTFVGSALVDMYAKCGLLIKALEVFDSLPARNQITWNALISGFSQLGKAEEVFNLFECMNIEGVKPDEATFAGVLKACSHGGDIEKGHRYFESMNKSYGITPGLSHHTCMVDLLGRAGQLTKAGEMMDNVPFHPDSVMSLALLSACRKWGDIDLGVHVFEHAMGSDEKLTSAYVCMYNMYADASMDKVMTC